MSVDCPERQDPYEVFAVDEHGRPTTYLSYRALKMLFSRPQRGYPASEIAEALAVEEEDIEVILRQLRLIDFVYEFPSGSGAYAYKLNSRNVELQAELEKFLLDVELDGLPVHIMLGYSPSAPSRSVRP